jgi:hypothetical protein
MFYVSIFNKETNEVDQIRFSTFQQAYAYARANGYQKFRDDKGGEYFV